MPKTKILLSLIFVMVISMAYSTEICGYVKFDLQSGWNAISIPLINDNLSTANDLQNLQNSITHVAKWDNEQHKWNVYDIVENEETFSLTVGMPLMVYSSREGNIIISGKISENWSPNFEDDMEDNVWNCKVVPFARDTIINVTTFHNEVPSTIHISKWDNEKQSWKQATYTELFGWTDNFFINTADVILFSNCSLDGRSNRAFEIYKE